jgi:zona occludens toxin
MGADLYSGVAGTGKSYHVAQVIYEKLRNGINIISNVDIDITKIPPKGNKPLGQYIFVSNKQWLSNSIRQYKKDYRGNLTPILEPCTDKFSSIQGLKGFALNFHKRDSKGHIILHQTFMIFDECHKIWESRSWNRIDRLAWIDFLTQFRKWGYDCILISQSENMIDKQIRASVIEHKIIHRNVSRFKKLGKILALPFGGNLFACVETDYTMSSKSAAKIRSYFIFGSNKYFDIYDTTQIF